jgi:lipopolysaccharide/colanic/teichoic acid biosynthesis glycosyltransferase
MKIAMQAERKHQISPTYRYFKVFKNPDISISQSERVFFYIGQNDENVERLSSECKKGMTEQSLEAARVSLSSMSKSGNCPSVIFIDLTSNEAEIRSFISFINKDTNLGRVPIIQNLRSLNSEQVLSYKRNRLVDELVDFKVDTSSLQDKISFLQKVKEGIWERRNNIKPEYKTSSVYKNSFFIKRALDILISATLLFLLFPLFLLIAVAIKLETRGPVFYNSYRAGRGYKIFKFYKFRTMKVGAERMLNSIAHLNKYNNFGHAPVFFKVDNDPRITHIGQLLRNTGFDEFPQLFNVLLGDMSIVGNRPLPLYEASALTNNEWAERFVAPSGITGLWQVTSYKKQSFTCYDRINMDILYARNNSIVKDLSIMISTPFVLMYGIFNFQEKETLQSTTTFEPEFSKV